jgi:hypothetical protein
MGHSARRVNSSEKERCLISVPTLIGQTVGTGSGTSLLSSELNSLANSSLVISSVGGTSGVYANVSGSGMGGYPYGRFVGTFSFGSSPTANSGIDIWLLVSADGSAYESGSSSITPVRPPDFTFPLIVQTASQVVDIIAPLPITANFKVLARNNGTGQSLAASANTVICFPFTDTIPSI